jgi:hypothetical protein
MIRVVCDACGAGFTAKDELAGRRGKCPSCGEGIVVPELEEEVEEDEDDEPVAAPVVSSRSGGRRRSSGGRRSSGAGRSARKKDYRTLGALLGVLTIALGIAGYFAMQEGEGPNPYSIGLDHMSNGRFELAIAQFELVPAGNKLYSQAQEKLASAREQLVAQKKMVDTKAANLLYQYVLSMEKNYVDRGGKGHFDADYVPNTRYMLKRAQEFMDRFPDDEHAAEIKNLMWRYEDVASLDTPPTEADVRAELRQRLISTNPNLIASVKVIDEFAAANPDKAETVRELRDEVQAANLRFWEGQRAKIEKHLTPGEENWQSIANLTGTYLKKVEGVPGVTEVAEARQLYERAIRGGG